MVTLTVVSTGTMPHTLLHNIFLSVLHIYAGAQTAERQSHTLALEVIDLRVGGGSAVGDGRHDARGGEVVLAVGGHVQGTHIGARQHTVEYQQVVERRLGRSPERSVTQVHIGARGHKVDQFVVVELCLGGDAGAVLRARHGTDVLLRTINIELHTVGARHGHGDKRPLAGIEIARRNGRWMVEVDPVARIVVVAHIGVARHVEARLR